MCSSCTCTYKTVTISKASFIITSYYCNNSIIGFLCEQEENNAISTLVFISRDILCASYQYSYSLIHQPFCVQIVTHCKSYVDTWT